MFSKNVHFSRSVRELCFLRKLFHGGELHTGNIGITPLSHNDASLLGDSKVQTPSNVRHQYEPISLSRQQLVEYIVNSIIYQDDHILAFNKPNGFPILTVRNSTFGSSVIYLDRRYHGKCEPSSEGNNEQGTSKQPHETSLSLFDILTDLKEHANSSTLEIGLSLPRLYSGIVLLTKTEKAKKQLKRYFETKRAQKFFFQTFSCVTAGIPSHVGTTAETVWCKLAEIDGKTLTVPAEDVSINTRKRGEVIQAEVELHSVTQNSKLQCAHLDIKSTRDKWNLVEWYCTRRLCSVLGDHVYSSRVGSVLGVPAHVDPHIALPNPQVLQHHCENFTAAVRGLVSEVQGLTCSEINTDDLPSVLDKTIATSIAFQLKLDSLKGSLSQSKSCEDAENKRHTGGENKDLTHCLKTQLLRNMEIQNSKLKMELAMREKLTDMKSINQQTQSLNEDWTVSHRNSMRLLKKLEEKCSHADKKNADLLDELSKSQQTAKTYKSLCEANTKAALGASRASLDLDELRPKTASKAMLASFRVNDVVRRNECLTEENGDLIREVQRLKRDNADLLKKAKRSMSDKETILVKLQTVESSKQELYKRLNREKQKHQSLNRSMTKQASEWIQTKKLLHQIEEGYRWDQVGPISPFGLDQPYSVQPVTKNSYMPRRVCLVEEYD